MRDVGRAQRVHRLARRRRPIGDVGKEPAVGPMERERAIGFTFDPVALFVDGAMMPATQRRKIRQRRRAAARPVADVMALADPNAAARKTTAAVPMMQRSA